MTIIERIAEELKLPKQQVESAVELLDAGNEIPFIARYRKEQTGSMDDQVLRALDTRLQYLRKLDARKEEIIASIDSQGKLTEELAKKIRGAETLVETEDLYLPYRPKRKTRASMAIAKGLEPLARMIAEQKTNTAPEREAEAFLTEEVQTVEDAIQGALDILAEEMANDAEIRKEMRELTFKQGKIVSKAKDEEAVSAYQNYYDYEEPVSRIAGHRVLALDRGEREEFLRVSVELNLEQGLHVLERKFVKAQRCACTKLMERSIEDCFTRLLFPAVEREIRRALTEKAATDAIVVFASNLRQLLMGAPLKNHTVIGVDPGYTHGCKLAVVDEKGDVLDTGIAYITMNDGPRKEQGIRLIRNLMIKHHVTAAAIGNGTASREAEQIVSGIIQNLPHPAAYMVVSEAGASVYSASPLAAEEFPDYDVNLRSAVSIARRLQDPLAELVKIDPQAIGVGQYQHDMPKAELKSALDGVVEGCVNEVGVDLNTASYSLLSHIAGINGTVAKNIVSYRSENGAFTDRKQLKKVSKLGPKAFEQCAGFLRVSGGKNPLDNTAVHPESYAVAEKILEEYGLTLKDFTAQGTDRLKQLKEHQNVSAIAQKLGVGVPTVQDILKELAKPGRDPRDELPPPLMRSGNVMELKDLKPGMELVGTVRNIVDFGCFVDAGVHEDGLVHISELCDHYVKHPMEVVKVGQVVTVWVKSVDLQRGRLALTMKRPK